MRGIILNWSTHSWPNFKIAVVGNKSYYYSPIFFCIFVLQDFCKVSNGFLSGMLQPQNMLIGVAVFTKVRGLAKSQSPVTLPVLGLCKNYYSHLYFAVVYHFWNGWWFSTLQRKTIVLQKSRQEQINWLITLLRVHIKQLSIMLFQFEKPFTVYCCKLLDPHGSVWTKVDESKDEKLLGVTITPLSWNRVFCFLYIFGCPLICNSMEKR